MDNFVVSARKYRPAGFEEVIGQAHITTTLQNANDNNQLAQALLFCGPRGVGKTTCARIVARMINGYTPHDPLAGNDPFNIYELDAASNNSVDDIRNLIDQVRYPPQQGQFKVYIIDEVHMLSNQAFNAFLKTLEEPPSYAVFILATTEKHKVIPTILSRCQIFDFNRIEVADIADQLGKIAAKEAIETEPEALHLIARKADGAMRDALSLFDLIVTFSHGKKVTYQATIDNLHILDYDYYFKMTACLCREDTAQVLLTFDDILKKGFDGHNFIVGLSSHFRDLMVCKDEATIDLLQVSESIKARYREQAATTPLSFLLTALNIASQCDIHYKASKNQRLHVELALIKIAHINSAVSLAQMNATGDPSKKKAVAEPDAEVTPPSTGESKPQTPDIAPEKLKDRPAAPPEPEGSVLKKAPSKTFDIPDLSALKEQVGKPEKTEKATADLRNNAFIKEDVDRVWKAFIQEKESAGQYQDLIAEVFKSPYVLEENKITIQLANEALDPVFEKLKPNLLSRLKDQLENDHIAFDVKIVEIAKEKMLYTDKEKFDHLAKKYPALKDMQEKLDLDPEF